ncbi:hypothetical protein [Pseudomonas sp. MWU12-2037]|uniref:hypothetical protein n=1 Tax=Pseudomonas sp. MWU12-2037 TaxID=2928690 RepID=UPI0020102C64|nr:hypothetical protein [Pseudomonas sp. MWU12-2037]
MTVSTKGGVGKSTLSQQVAATYLLSRLGQANLIELDDLNLDSAWMNDSAVKTTQQPVGDDAMRAVEAVMFGQGRNSFVLDVGGNRTAESTLSSLGEAGLLSRFDLILIPLRDEGQDCENARRTIQLLLDADPECRIALFLNDISLQTQSLEDPRLLEDFAEVFDLAHEFHLHLLVMPRIERYGRSRRIGKTIFELAEEAAELETLFADKVMRLEDAGKFDEAMQMNRMAVVVRRSRGVRKMIELVHNRLDEILMPVEGESHVA